MTRGRVFLVEDEPKQRSGLRELLTLRGFDVVEFDSAIDFLNRLDVPNRACAVVDLRLDCEDGIELMRKTRNSGKQIPFVVVSAFGDIPTAVEAVRAGACTFMEKPLDLDRLISEIDRAINQFEKEFIVEQEKKRVLELFLSLNEKERMIVKLILDNTKNATIAKRFDKSERWVEGQRAIIFKKLDVTSATGLARKVMLISLPEDYYPDPNCILREK